MTTPIKKVIPPFIHASSDLRINSPHEVAVVNLTSSIVQGHRHHWVNFHLNNGAMVSVMCYSETSAKALFKDYNDHVDFVAEGTCDCDDSTDSILENKRPPAFETSTPKTYKKFDVE